MKSVLKTTFAALILAGSITAGAYAGSTATVTTHPCASEHQSVVAACKNGDPCSAACKEARKAMKACRVANNLPQKEHNGEHKGHGCKSTTATTGAPVTAPETSR